jgi:hypothetical protein
VKLLINLTGNLPNLLYLEKHFILMKYLFSLLFFCILFYGCSSRVQKNAQRSGVTITIYAPALIEKKINKYTTAVYINNFSDSSQQAFILNAFGFYLTNMGYTVKTSYDSPSMSDSSDYSVSFYKLTFKEDKFFHTVQQNTMKADVKVKSVKILSNISISKRGYLKSAKYHNWSFATESLGSGHFEQRTSVLGLINKTPKDKTIYICDIIPMAPDITQKLLLEQVQAYVKNIDREIRVGTRWR